MKIITYLFTISLPLATVHAAVHLPAVRAATAPVTSTPHDRANQMHPERPAARRPATTGTSPRKHHYHINYFTAYQTLKTALNEAARVRDATIFSDSITALQYQAPYNTSDALAKLIYWYHPAHDITIFLHAALSSLLDHEHQAPRHKATLRTIFTHCFSAISYPVKIEICKNFDLFTYKKLIEIGSCHELLALLLITPKHRTEQITPPSPLDCITKAIYGATAYTAIYRLLYPFIESYPGNTIAPLNEKLSLYEQIMQRMPRDGDYALTRCLDMATYKWLWHELCNDFRWNRTSAERRIHDTIKHILRALEKS